MSQIKFRHGRKFPPRITREELYNQTNKKVEECGVNNHFQSEFTNNIAKEVVGLKDYKYESLQPELKLRDNINWKSAFTIVQHYLKDFKMNITLDTIATELQNKKLPVNESILKNTNSVSFLGKLVDDSNNLPSFKNQVSRFSKSEKLPESNYDNASSKQKLPQRYTPKEQEKLFEPNSKKNDENSKITATAPSEKQQSNVDQPLNNDDFEDIQLDDDFDNNDIIESPVKSSPPANLPNKSKVPVEKSNDDFEESFNDDNVSTNGKAISPTVFSKSDYTINVDELQSDDGKQEAEKKQLLQNLMNEHEQKLETPQPEENAAQDQNQIHSEIADNNSDIDVDIPLDSNSSDDFNSAQNNHQNATANDDFVDEHSTSDINIQNGISPSKQPQSGSLINTQNSAAEDVEVFNSEDDFEVDLGEDFEQDNEKEKKSEPESLKSKSNTVSPKHDTNNDFDDDFDNVPSEDDIEVENLPSSNNSPSKQPETQTNDDSIHVSDNIDVDDFDDFEIEEGNSPTKSPTAASETQKENQTPVKQNNEADDFEDVVDDFEDEEVKDYESEKIDVDVDVDIDGDDKEEPNNSSPSKAHDEGKEKNEQSDDFGDFDSDDFNIDDN